VFPSRSSLAVVLVASIALSARPIDPPQPAPPSKEQIAKWIKQLGSDDFAERQVAARKLWEAGQAAEDAVAAASKDEDIEIRRRANALHDKFRWGIYPDTPEAIVELINRYKGFYHADIEQRFDPHQAPFFVNERSALIRSFLEKGVPGSLALKKIFRADPDRLYLLLGLELPRAMPALLQQQQYAVVENVLDSALEVKFKYAIDDYTAWWLLRGSIDERIAYHTKLEGKENRRQAEILAYLHRAKGDIPAALAAARRSGNDQVIDTILIEMGAWKELALRGKALGMSDEDTRAAQLAHRATYHRLAGSSAAARDTIEEMRGYQKTLPHHDTYFVSPDDVIAKAFIINDLPEDAVEALAVRGAWVSAYVVLVARYRFAEADALVTKAREEGYPYLARLEAMQASTWCLLGNKEKALPVFVRQAEKLKKKRKDGELEALVEEEMRAGLTDLAFEHAGSVLNAEGGSVCPPDIFFHLFPVRERTRTAYTMHLLVFGIRRGREYTFSTLLERIRQLLAGKASREEVTALLDACNPGVGDSRLRSGMWNALAHVASLAGLEAREQSFLEYADTIDSLIKLGDIQASKKQWEAAARYYQMAHKKQFPLSWADHGYYPGYLGLYLYGHALVQAGHDKEGQEAMLHAHWMLLGRATDRYQYALELLKRGHIQDSQREHEMILHMGDMCRTELIRRNALSRKDYLACAAALQENAVWKLSGGKNDQDLSLWRKSTTLLAQSASIHRYRASGLVKVGKVAEAIKEADLALAILPSNLDPAIGLIPELEALGRQDEAGSLYRRTRGVVEQLCKDHPRSALGHNGVAWLGACCRRDLDDALVHARKAVELAPEFATYHETLAEVYFQMGQKDRAIEALRKAESLSTKSLHFQKQFKRLEAGDPKAPRVQLDKEDDD
jgi:tetratricopeptide (TPR) repeat protein